MPECQVSKFVDPSSTLTDGDQEHQPRVAENRWAASLAQRRHALAATARYQLEIAMERYFNQQIIERYRKLLDVVSDQTQRRQIVNLLEEEEDKARDLRRPKYRLNLSDAA